MHSTLVLELTRGHDAHRSEVALRDETEYLLRWGDGTYASARFPWSRMPPADLQAVLQGGAPAPARQRVGDALRAFLEPGWSRLEAEVLRRTEKEDLFFVIRCNAGELRRLPLELVTLEPSGVALGQRRNCYVQWEWPGTETVPRELPAPAPPAGETLLFAWSAAGGPLDGAGHLRVVQREAQARGYPGKVEQIGQASIQRLRQALDAARAGGRAVSVLHLLCHGGPLPEPESGYGLWLEDEGEGAKLVDPLTFAEALTPYAGLVGCLVLCACHGANLADRDNVLGSVAERLHRVGFPAVVASRATLSSAGAESFAADFYKELLSGEPLHRAMAAGRHGLGAEWAGLQLFARTKDGPQYPVMPRASQDPVPPPPPGQREDLKTTEGGPVLISKLNETTHEVEREGKQRMAGGLHPTALVATPGGPKRLEELQASADPAERQALGHHLWSQLQLSSMPRAGEELVIESEEEHVLSLPWSNLHDGALWLLDHDVLVRCQHPSTGRAARPLSATPQLAIALPPPELQDATFKDAQEWRRLWHEELGHRLQTLDFAKDAGELRELLGARVDIAYLRVRPGRFDGRAGPLVAYDGFSLADLEQALERGPPRLLVIGCPDDPAARSATWFSRLARFVPSVVVVPDSADHRDEIDGAAARRFVVALMREGASPAQICLRMGKERLLAYAPHCIGGGTAAGRRAPPSRQTDWEFQLDRIPQVSQVEREVRQVIKDSGGSLVLVWHGPSTAGLQRLHGRLLQELKKEIEHAIPRELGLAWPRTAPPAEDDFAGIYQRALGLAGFEAADVAAALKRQAPELSEETKHPILYVHHHVLDADFYPRRLNAQVIRDYIRWWMDGIAAHRPPGLPVILALAFAAAEGQKWIEGELKDVLDAFCAEPIDGFRVMPLNQLENVQDRDITDFLTKFVKDRIRDREDRMSVAREIMARTGGIYEKVIRELEDIESYWPVLRDAWNARKKGGSA